MRRIYGDTRARLMSYVEVDTNGCWLWLRSCQPSGYGQIKISGRVVLAHRAVWQELRGPIPAGMQLDHLCRVRRCVNPDHLEVVEPVENWRRGQSPTRLNALATHCIHGHSLADAYITREGNRSCRWCKRRYSAKKRKAS